MFKPYRLLLGICIVAICAQQSALSDTGTLDKVRSSGVITLAYR